MTAFEAWDVVKVPFPYTNRPVLQRRPGLVVAIQAAADAPVLLWVLMMTSAVHRRWSGDVEVSDLAEAGLPAPSVVRTVKIATIEASDAERAGRMPLADRLDVAGFLSSTLRGALDGFMHIET